MVTICQLLLAVLLVQAFVNAAPNKNSAKEDKSNNTPETPVALLEDLNDSKDTTLGQRRKRYYNRNDYGYPPWYARPSYSESGPDPLIEIHRRLEDIIANLNQPRTPPPVTIYYPVFYVPQGRLICVPRSKPSVPPKEHEETSTLPSTSNGTSGTSATPTIFSRGEFPDTRPISFDPITPKTPLKRPPPPVEHGTIQIGNNEKPPLSSSIATPTDSQTEFPSSTPVDKGTSVTICDKSLVVCCHQAVTPINECFASLGCSNRKPSTNPCDPILLYEVTTKFIKYYTQKG